MAKKTKSKSKTATQKLANQNKKQLVANEEERALFGAYNSHKSEYFQAYAQGKAERMGNLSVRKANELNKETYLRAKKDFENAFGDNIDNLAGVAETLDSIADSWKTQTTSFTKGIYNIFDADEVDKVARLSMAQGPPKPGEISSYNEAMRYFQKLMSDLMGAIASATQTDTKELLDISNNISDEGLTDAQMETIIENLDKVQGILMKDAKGVANAYYSLINNLMSISSGFQVMADKFDWMDLKGQKHSFMWFGTDKGKITPKTSLHAKVKYGSVAKSIQTTIYLVQGALVERFVALGLQSAMSDVNQILGTFEGQDTIVVGDVKTSSGKSGKADIAITGQKINSIEDFKSAVDGDIESYGVTVKAASYNAKSVKFETGSKLNKVDSVKDLFPSTMIKNVYFTLNHVRNVNPSVSRNTGQWVKEIDKMAAAVGAYNVEKVVGNRVKDSIPVYFMAFGDKFIPVYKFYEDLMEGNKVVHFVSKGNDYFKYDWSREKDYENLKDFGMNKFNYGSRGYEPYVAYVNTKVVAKITAQIQYTISTL